MKRYKITALVENTTFKHNYIAQHGQSLLIETDDYKFLFDVGETPGAISHNMNQLSVSIEDINDIVISHRHIDHIGTLSSLISEMKEQKIYLPLQLGEPDIKKPSGKYDYLKPNDSGDYDIAISKKDVSEIKKYKYIQIVDEEGLQISEDIYTTGCLGDWMMEQAVVIDQHELGLTVLLGCSHPGAESLIKRAKAITANDKIRLVVGGMHYSHLTVEEMREKANVLLKLGVGTIIPSHCTTVTGAELLKQVFGKNCLISKTGTFGAGNSVEIGDDIKSNFVLQYQDLAFFKI